MVREVHPADRPQRRHPRSRSRSRSRNHPRPKHDPFFSSSTDTPPVPDISVNASRSTFGLPGDTSSSADSSQTHDQTRTMDDSSDKISHPPPRVPKHELQDPETSPPTSNKSFHTVDQATSNGEDAESAESAVIDPQGVSLNTIARSSSEPVSGAQDGTETPKLHHIPKDLTPHKRESKPELGGDSLCQTLAVVPRGGIIMPMRRLDENGLYKKCGERVLFFSNPRNECIICSESLATILDRHYAECKERGCGVHEFTCVWACTRDNQCEAIVCLDCAIDYANHELARFRPPACPECDCLWPINLLRTQAEGYRPEHLYPIVPPSLDHLVDDQNNIEALQGGMDRFRQLWVRNFKRTLDEIKRDEYLWFLQMAYFEGGFEFEPSVEQQAVLAALWEASSPLPAKDLGPARRRSMGAFDPELTPLPRPEPSHAHAAPPQPAPSRDAQPESLPPGARSSSLVTRPELPRQVQAEPSFNRQRMPLRGSRGYASFSAMPPTKQENKPSVDAQVDNRSDPRLSGGSIFERSVDPVVAVTPFLDTLGHTAERLLEEGQYSPEGRVHRHLRRISSYVDVAREQDVLVREQARQLDLQKSRTKKKKPLLLKRIVSLPSMIFCKAPAQGAASRANHDPPVKVPLISISEFNSPPRVTTAATQAGTNRAGSEMHQAALTTTANERPGHARSHTISPLMPSPDAPHAGPVERPSHGRSVSAGHNRTAIYASEGLLTGHTPSTSTEHFIDEYLKESEDGSVHSGRDEIADAAARVEKVDENTATSGSASTVSESTSGSVKPGSVKSSATSENGSTATSTSRTASSYKEATRTSSAAASAHTFPSTTATDGHADGKVVDTSDSASQKLSVHPPPGLKHSASGAGSVLTMGDTCIGVTSSETSLATPNNLTRDPSVVSLSALAGGPIVRSHSNESISFGASCHPDFGPELKLQLHSLRSRSNSSFNVSVNTERSSDGLSTTNIAIVEIPGGVLSGIDHYSCPPDETAKMVIKERKSGYFGGLFKRKQ
ncbi:hypothetical protein B9479_001193 [Cryptococcus floricola]|uniref:Uncharacterized protein n=1 Tax=Cryptococcus floricola TaxID=2591691 RepID=A0A5D3B323_9TREE|nr:hypothetical protein B9479_001193 [Cryptococcus floricola]